MFYRQVISVFLFLLIVANNQLIIPVIYSEQSTCFYQQLVSLEDDYLAPSISSVANLLFDKTVQQQNFISILFLLYDFTARKNLQKNQYLKSIHLIESDYFYNLYQKVITYPYLTFT